MAAITPSQLIEEFTNQALTGLANLIVVQADGSKSISYAALQAQLSSSIQNSTVVSDVLANMWISPLEDIENTLLGKADVTHTHTPANVGLSNVHNIAKENMPVSNPQMAALSTKADATATTVPFIALTQPKEW